MHFPGKLLFPFLFSTLLLAVACSPQRTLQKYNHVTKEKPAAGDPVARVEDADPTSASKALRTVLQTAISYEGTPYKFGGTTRKGMDCSGLVYTSFQSVNKTLPRTSADMASAGKELKKSEIRPGNLVFFSTGSSSRINHVGLVTRVKDGDIEFIHSSTKRGVVRNWLSEEYYTKCYKKAVAVAL
ncbi:MAG: NlpC/P60 family protein [Bacteroidetes bacterium]|jgi:probable lipoprotein NlpC|nr:MAG: NlpC/P60 family protein [Bacteroidota bacterium]